MERICFGRCLKVFLVLGILMLVDVKVEAVSVIDGKVLSASKQFIESLSDQQRAMAMVEYTQANAVKWTNLPCGL